MNIQRLFERGVAEGLFTDFDVCVRGPIDIEFSGGQHLSKGARLFDVSSLTKAVTYLLMWKLFFQEAISPEDDLGDFLSVPNSNGRQLWHFMTYVVQTYAFDFDMLRIGNLGPFKEILMKTGFAHWEKEFHYDNLASAYVGLFLESFFSGGIEDILHTHLLGGLNKENFLFNPVRRGLVQPGLIVPTRADEGLRGLVHDPLSSNHPHDNIVAAGLFSDAAMIADIFHVTIGAMRRSLFYDRASSNQLGKLGIVDYEYALGFDIPYAKNLTGISVDRPLLFAGWTGCRVFFTRDPAVTVCILTNRVFCGDNEVSRKRFSDFSWEVIREILCS